MSARWHLAVIPPLPCMVACVTRLFAMPMKRMWMFNNTVVFLINMDMRISLQPKYCSYYQYVQ